MTGFSEVNPEPRPLSASGELHFTSIGNIHIPEDDLYFYVGTTAGTIDYVEVRLDVNDNNATPSAADIGGPGWVYAEGTGLLNGDSGWAFCLTARDDRPRGKQGKVGDRFWIRIYDEETGSCPNPTYSFKTMVEVGDVDAVSENTDNF